MRGSWTTDVQTQNAAAGVSIAGTVDDDVITPEATVAGQPYPGPGADTITGFGGHDTIDGAAGNDVLNSGANSSLLPRPSVVVGADGDDTIYGASAQDTLDGGAGNDSVWAGSERADLFPGPNLLLLGEGDDTAIGGWGPDSIDAGPGWDRLYGGAGNDTFAPGSGGDTISASTGVDRVTYAQSSSAIGLDMQDGGWSRAAGDAVGDVLPWIPWVDGSAFGDTILGTGLDNRLAGGLGEDSLDGRDGSDTLLGQPGADTLVGGRGPDRLVGGDGADEYRFLRGSGQDLVTGFRPGGDGHDVLVLDPSAGPFARILANTADVLGGTDPFGSPFSGAVVRFGTDAVWLAGVAKGALGPHAVVVPADYVGTEGPDSWTGTGAPEAAYGLAGNDTLDGAGGRDTLRGGEGNDLLVGIADSRDLAYGEGGNDTLVVDIDADARARAGLLDGGTGVDLLVVSAGRAEVYLDFAADKPAVRVIVDGMLLDSPVRHVEHLAFSADPTAGADNIVAGLDVSDTMHGGAGADTLWGRGGDDLLTANGTDAVPDRPGAGDLLDGGDGNDALRGADGDDVLSGGTGDDLLVQGGLHHPGQVALSTGSDTIDGGAGDDHFLGLGTGITGEGAYGRSLVTGGEGHDTFEVDVANAAGALFSTVITDLDRSDDRLLLRPDALAAWLKGALAAEQRDTDVVFSLFSQGTLASGFHYEGFSDRLVLQDSERDAVLRDLRLPDPGSRSDNVQGTDATDLLSGGFGPDALSGNAGDDSVRGGQGADTLDGGDGRDNLAGGYGDDVARGRAGDDRLDGGIGDDRLFGDVGHDTLQGGPGQDTLAGGVGDDLLRGQGMLDGGSGNDTLQGAGTLTGGSGDDLFQFATVPTIPVEATVTDFNGSADLIDVRSWGVASFDAFMAENVQVQSDGTVVLWHEVYRAAEVIALQRVTPTMLTADNVLV